MNRAKEIYKAFFISGMENNELHPDDDSYDEVNFEEAYNRIMGQFPPEAIDNFNQPDKLKQAHVSHNEIILPSDAEIEKQAESVKRFICDDYSGGAIWMREEIKERLRARQNNEVSVAVAVENILKPKYMNDTYGWREIEEAIKTATGG